MARKLKIPDVVTVAMLRRKEACTEGVDEFVEAFPLTNKSGVAITLANARIAIKAGLTLAWFYDQFVTSQPETGNPECRAGVPLCDCAATGVIKDVTAEVFMRAYRKAKKAAKEAA